MSQSGRFTGGGGPSTAVETLTGNNPVAVGIDGADNINIVGTGVITVTGNAGTNTLTISSTSSPDFPWTVVTASSESMAVNNGYIVNNGGTCTLTLPAVASFGDVVSLANLNNATGMKIAQNAGQSILISSGVTTTGVTGYLQSTSIGDNFDLLCVVDNTTWMARGIVGNITFV